MGSKFYTPDGFTDTLPGVCAFKKDAESKLRRLFSLHGYQEIETPDIEYCDIYTKPDFVEEENLYKFTDSKGRLLAARYDGTVPAARFAATLYKDEPLPLRLSYIGNMYRFNQSGGGKQSEFTQAGVELMGVSGSDSDAEVIALAIKTALEAGLTDLQISIGQAGIFKGLARQMNLDSEISIKISEAIEAKDSVTIENTASALGLSDTDKETLLLLPELTGTYDVIETLNKRVTDSEAKDALNNLKEILDYLDDHGFLKFVSVDPGLLGGIRYYTGVIFKGYTYEVGFPILGGGRYDSVVGVFGRDLECVGFSFSLTLAITALLRQGASMDARKAEIVIGYDKRADDARPEAIAYAERLRTDGIAVILDSSGLDEDQLNEFADKRGIGVVMFFGEDKEVQE